MMRFGTIIYKCTSETWPVSFLVSVNRVSSQVLPQVCLWSFYDRTCAFSVLASRGVYAPSVKYYAPRRAEEAPVVFL